jgi:hypothetical protein
MGWSSACQSVALSNKRHLKERLAEEATRLRKQAQGTPPAFERELLVRKARRSEAASHMIEWLTSAPKEPR